MTDEGVRLKAAEDLQSAERQIEALRAQILEQEQHAEDVRRFLALYQQYQPSAGSQAGSASAAHAVEPASNLVVAAFGGQDR